MMSTLTLTPLQTLRNCRLNNATLRDYHYVFFFSVNFWWGTSGETSLRAKRTLTTRKHIALTNHITMTGRERRNSLSPAHLCKYNDLQGTLPVRFTFFRLYVYKWDTYLFNNRKIREWALFRWIVDPQMRILPSFIILHHYTFFPQWNTKTLIGCDQILKSVIWIWESTDWINHWQDQQILCE